MRAPKRRRPRSRAVGVPPGARLQEAATRAVYVGSPEHKDAPSFAGQPRPRADASICRRELSTRRAEITRWLRSAIESGLVSELFESGFPRYVWHREGDVLFEARLVNSGNGEYKGYPLNRDEWPVGL